MRTIDQEARASSIIIQAAARGRSSTHDPENSLTNDIPEHGHARKPGNVIITTGAVIAVLLGIPSVFMGLFAVVQVITGDKLIAGSLGVLWAYLSTTGAYELNRRKFDWDRGRQYSDRHLLAGTIAVSTGLAISGAMHETMPGLAVVPALSAILQANDGHEKNTASLSTRQSSLSESALPSGSMQTA